MEEEEKHRMLLDGGFAINYYRVHHAKISLTDLHLKSGVDFLTVSDIEETGRIPDLPTLIRLISALDFDYIGFWAYYVSYFI